jgi:hypothetical protein
MPREDVATSSYDDIVASGSVPANRAAVSAKRYLSFDGHPARPETPEPTGTLSSGRHLSQDFRCGIVRVVGMLNFVVETCKHPHGKKMAG